MNRKMIAYGSRKGKLKELYKRGVYFLVNVISKGRERKINWVKEYYEASDEQK